MKHGLVVGKFFPPHTGHHYLIKTALVQVEHLTIMVIEQVGQQPTGQLRASWLETTYPTATVVLVPDIYDDDNSQAWADYTVEILGEVPDVVFTSEEYGCQWAKLMGCRHVLLDIDRKKFPISGTAVRKDPIGNWKFLPPEVKAFYAKRICVLGAESTGTTTLTKQLAEKFQTTWVPEFGRFYTYGKVTADEIGATWQSQEFEYIANQQNQYEDQMARFANKILFCDTDSFATAVWHERYMGNWSESVEKLFIDRHYDLYLLTDVDIPFVQDGIRDGEHIRFSMHRRFIELLEKYSKPYLTVSGSKAKRLKVASVACREFLIDSNVNYSDLSGSSLQKAGL